LASRPPRYSVDDAAGEGPDRPQAARGAPAVRLAEERLGHAGELPAELMDRVTSSESDLLAVLDVGAALTDHPKDPLIQQVFSPGFEVWEEIEYCSRSVASHGSRERFRQANSGQPVAGRGIYAAAFVEYEKAFAAGYLLRMCESARENSSG
jgi:hypothetical protein